MIPLYQEEIEPTNDKPHLTIAVTQDGKSDNLRWHLHCIERTCFASSVTFDMTLDLIKENIVEALEDIKDYLAHYKYTFYEPPKEHEWERYNKDLILEYLLADHKMCQTLGEIIPYIKKYFPSEELRLVLSEDPEGVESDNLVIYIMSNDEVDIAIAKKKQFGLDWYEHIGWTYGRDEPMVMLGWL